jgi:sugar phosphate isomerase/epimerase
MKLCVVSESLGHLSFEDAAKVSAELGLAGLENKAALDLTGRLETIGHENVKDRSWSYITLGYGHGEQWWRQFCYRLRLNGYDGWLSIEHEDIVLSRMDGMRKSVDLLKRTMIEEKSDYAMPGS